MLQTLSLRGWLEEYLGRQLLERSMGRAISALGGLTDGVESTPPSVKLPATRGVLKGTREVGRTPQNREYE